MNKIQEAIAQRKISGDGAFSKRCAAWLEAETGSKKALLTTSCSDALELSALLTLDVIFLGFLLFAFVVDFLILR